MIKIIEPYTKIIKHAWAAIKKKKNKKDIGCKFIVPKNEVWKQLY